jgi:hypothetical protein
MPMTHSEQLAKRVVEAVISGSSMRFNEAQSRGEVDFDLVVPGQPNAAVEVTAHMDPEYEETAKAIADPKKGGRQIPRVLSKHDWRITPSKNARITRIRKEIDRYLADVEAAGITTFHFSHAYRDPSVLAICRDLRVDAGSIIDGLHPGFIHLALPITGGVTAASLAQEAILAEAEKADNTKKLGASGKQDRYLLVYMDHQSYLTRTGFLEFEPPPEPVDLPSEITEVWAFSEGMTPGIGVVWRARAGSTWERIEVSLP